MTREWLRYLKSQKVSRVGRPERAFKLIWSVGEGGLVVSKVFGSKDGGGSWD